MDRKLGSLIRVHEYLWNRDGKVSELKHWERIVEKKTELLAVLVLLTIFAAGFTYASGSGALTGTDAAQKSDLVAEYRFDTGTGDTAYDSARSNDGTINGASWRSGVEGGALNFDGSDDKVPISSEALYASEIDSNDEITVSTWLSFDQIRSESTTRKLVATYNTWRPGYGIHVRQADSNTNQIATAIPEDSGFNEVQYDVTQTGKWFHAVYVKNSTDISLYINGEHIGSTGSYTTNYPESADFYIGGKGSSRNFPGKIDNTKVYGNALNQSQINSLYNRGSWRIGAGTEEDDPDKVLDIDFQHRNSSHVLDESDYQNHGQLQGGASQEYANSCIEGRCYSFDGSDDYLDSGTDESLNITGSITLSAWIYPEKLDSSWQGIISKDADDSYQFRVSDYNTATITIANSGGTTTQSSTSTLENNTWYHVTGTYNGSQVCIYLDGSLEECKGLTGDINSVASTPLTVGKAKDPEKFKGRIDQAKIFNRSLSQQEIIEKTQGLKSNGAVLDMRFTSGGGDHVEDYSRENNHASLNPNETYGPSRVDGSTGGALSFDGSNDHVSISGDDSLHMSDGTWTQVIWAKGEYDGSNRNALRLSGGWQTLMGIYSSDTWRAGFYDGTGWNWLSGDVDTSRLHQIVFVGRESEIELWIDGKEVDSLSTTASPPTSRDGGGGYIGSVGGDRYYNGLIEKVKVYQQPLSDARIKQLYSTGKSGLSSGSDSLSDTDLQNDLVLSQTFNRVETCGQSDTISCPSGMSGDVAVDESGEANHGEVNGPNQDDAHDCTVGDCLGFSGGSVDMSYSENLNDTLGTLPVTISMWYKPTEDVSDWQNVMPWTGSYSGGSGSVRVEVDGQQSALYTRWISQDGSANWARGGGPGIETGEWQFHTSVITESQIKTFTNGELHASTSHSFSSLANLDSDLSIIPGFSSSIDQVRVYNHSLSEEEVWRLYTQGRDRETGMAGPVAHYRFDAGPRVCILNQDGSLSNGGWGAPSDSELKNTLEDEGWNTKYVQVGDITEDGWKSCEVIVFPKGEDYPAFDKSANFCGNVNGEGGEHDVYMEMKEFMQDGGLFIGTWGAGLYYPQAWDGSQWVSYPNSCSQFSGDSLYDEESTPRCSNLGYSCHSPGNYKYGNINQSVTPALPGTVTSASQSNRWASDLDINVMQAYNATSGSTVSGKYAGLEKVGDGWHFFTGSSEVFNPSNYNNASDAWNNLLTWYAGNGAQNIWDTASNNTGTVSGDWNAPAYTSGRNGKALKFEGSDDFVEVPHSSRLEVSNTGELTITGWVRLRDTSKDDWERLLEKGSHSNGGYSVQRDNPSSDPVKDKRLKFYFANSGGWENSINIVEPSANSLNSWHSFGVTVEDGKVTTYFDGRQTNQETGWSYTSTTMPLYLGDRNSGTSSAFTGSLDDIRVYPYALSQQQVKQVMNSGGVSVGG